ncbi:MAG: TolC family protein [Rhodoferax sp.]|nr:TolC family protein [Rhodoferax sp.]
MAMEQAWRLNPQAAGLDARESEARAAQDVAAGLTPEPGSVSIGGLSDQFNRNQGKQEYEVELAVPLWLPGQKALRVAEASSRINEAITKRAAVRLEISGELREAWWALAAARNAKVLATRRLETARALEVDVMRRYRVGELSRIDANLAQTETHAASAELVEAQTSLLQAEQSVHILTGFFAPENLDEEPPVEQKIPSESVVETHPLLAAATAVARSARARVQVAEVTRRAAPELALRVVRERGDFAESYANSVGIKLKIPFSSSAYVRRDTSATQAEANQAEAEMLRTQTRIRFEAERARHNLQAAQRQLAMAQERRQLSSENLRLTEKAFALGESDLATLLRIRLAAFDADAFYDRQRVARAAAISRLNQALGVLL